ncbi:hypothetical protein N7495_005411 [Penicillium taxi]|uniref:uncharacterized protein n=1 Tax=Penicillium taxi TaxID=168475 RepID=UPI002545B371|nr:uncharacterized protein N7495_005411 [Penicillium taxi]KAJ5893720.1 hypothetical protein N7495_005411 [Penicillium taxi]
MHTFSDVKEVLVNPGRFLYDSYLQPHSGYRPQRLLSPKKTKTVAEADAELRERLEQISGNGGAAGIQYEDGKPNTMKRGVRENMFRVI